MAHSTIIIRGITGDSAGRRSKRGLTLGRLSQDKQLLDVATGRQSTDIVELAPFLDRISQIDASDAARIIVDVHGDCDEDDGYECQRCDDAIMSDAYNLPEWE